MTMKPNAASNCSRSLGISDERDPPAVTPITLATTKALDEPRNTANGLFVELLRVIVVS